MDAALARQTQQVQTARRAHACMAASRTGLRKNSPDCDHEVDPHHVHQEDAARADIEVADFAVAHLPFRQADGRAGGLDQRVGKLAQQFVVSRLARGGDGVPLDGRGEAPAIEDRQDQRLGARH